MKQHKTINKTLNPICKNTQKLTQKSKTLINTKVNSKISNVRTIDFLPKKMTNYINHIITFVYRD